MVGAPGIFSMALVTVSCGMPVMEASMAEEYRRSGERTVAAARRTGRVKTSVLQYVHQVKARISPIS